MTRGVRRVSEGSKHCRNKARARMDVNRQTLQNPPDLCPVCTCYLGPQLADRPCMCAYVGTGDHDREVQP
jgi:hypothetical protein